MLVKFARRFRLYPSFIGLFFERLAWVPRCRLPVSLLLRLLGVRNQRDFLGLLLRKYSPTYVELAVRRVPMFTHRHLLFPLRNTMFSRVFIPYAFLLVRALFPLASNNITSSHIGYQHVRKRQMQIGKFFRVALILLHLRFLLNLRLFFLGPSCDLSVIVLLPPRGQCLPTIIGFPLYRFLFDPNLRDVGANLNCPMFRFLLLALALLRVFLLRILRFRALHVGHVNFLEVRLSVHLTKGGNTNRIPMLTTHVLFIYGPYFRLFLIRLSRLVPRLSPLLIILRKLLRALAPRFPSSRLDALSRFTVLPSVVVGAYRYTQDVVRPKNKVSNVTRKEDRVRPSNLLHLRHILMFLPMFLRVVLLFLSNFPIRVFRRCLLLPRRLPNFTTKGVRYLSMFPRFNCRSKGVIHSFNSSKVGFNLLVQK